MHLVITDIPASRSGHPCASALPANGLPHLARLLRTLHPAQRITTDEFAWVMPHETLLARALQLPETDTPWAAWETRTRRTACAWIHPVHWQVGMDHLTMSQPAALEFDEALSREHLAVLIPFFAEVGIELCFDQPLRWLAQGEVFTHMPCASLDRTVGRNIDAWMPPAASPEGAQIRRLQNEVQMLLYNHPLTDVAQAAGRLPMNSFWVSGAGRLEVAPPDSANLQLERGLQAAVWAQGPETYRQTWQTIDDGALKSLCDQLDQGQPVTLSLCSDSVAQTFVWREPTWTDSFKRLLTGKPSADWSRWL